MRVEIDTESKKVKVLEDIEISVLAQELAQFLGPDWQTWTMVGAKSSTPVCTCNGTSCSCKSGLDNLTLV